ncbi:MAG: hypothetical protein HY816_19820 [Candidatus Wallbacteria bacterium]|nr:hypothetical protein [Candidatus Wallbacteria bacterium]
MNLDRLREQIQNDTFAPWSAQAWAKAHLLTLLTRGAYDHVHADSRGIVRDISIVGCDSIVLNSVGNVFLTAAREISVELRFSASVQWSGRVDRSDLQAALALKWKLSPRPDVGPRKTVLHTLRLPVPVQATLDGHGRLRSSEIRNLGYGRGIMGRNRF